MKGQIFDVDKSITLTVDGEKWNQGEIIKGNIEITNTSTHNIDIQSTKIQLCYGDFKKVQQKSKNAFQIVSTVDINLNQQLKPKSSLKGLFEFETGLNAFITDKKGSLFILYYPKMVNDSLEFAHLQLIIQPHFILDEFSKILEMFFRFKLKEVKNSSGGTIYNYLAPSSKEFSNLDSFDLVFKFHEDKSISIETLAALKKIEVSSSVNKLKKYKKEFTHVLTPKEYFLAPGIMNQDRIIQFLNEILNQIKMNIFS
jgi:hypothetical protein